MSTVEKVFRPSSIEVLARTVLRDLAAAGPVYGLPRESLVEPDDRMSLVRYGVEVGAPLGVAAGPHTQMTQNIVASWLCGARFIELKTVQILDEIKVSRPCIDSEDETFNCEWSQELTLDQSFDEYLKAWVIIHLLAHKFGKKSPKVFFNMSVGYDLAGIQSEPVQRFLRRMRDCSVELKEAIAKLAPIYPQISEIQIPSQMSNLVTLSTMHGCPPAEIERIGRYLLSEMKLNTWVKLNPTLLGPSRLRGILNDTMGYGVTVPDAAFDHDPRFEDAMAMVRNLADAAKKTSIGFGVKLSNTLEVINHRSVFPSNEKMMYMSGKALHPLTLTLADLVTTELDNSVPLSFCGGADAFNYADLVSDNLGPITVCTDLLKPGGYARLAQYTQNLSARMDSLGAHSLDELVLRSGSKTSTDAKVIGQENLHAHAQNVIKDPAYRARAHHVVPKGERVLKAFDCIAAPCQDACPSHQNIPDYMHLVASGRPKEALAVIGRTNAMPMITGRVCDHPCVERCIRNHYDSPLAIREIKRYAVEASGSIDPPKAQEDNGVSVAVIGAGPAGVSAAYYLRLAGFGVTVFEARKRAGGMADRVIPLYRLPETSIDSDVDLLRKVGVDVHFGQALGADFTLDDLRARGFVNVILAVGAQAGRKLGVEGEDATGVFEALDFLDRVRRGERVNVGKRVLVIGGGNSAMDAARTAKRMVGDGSVEIVYRRTRDQMPADLEEIEACIEEKVEIRDLLAPAKVVQENGKVTGLLCQKMKLGDLDDSGRPRPVPIEGAEDLVACDAILVGISQESVIDFLGSSNLDRRRDTSVKADSETGETSIPGVYAAGDLSRGPSTVIKAIADGRKVARSIAKKYGKTIIEDVELAKGLSTKQLLNKRSSRSIAQLVPIVPAAQRSGFNEVISGFGKEAATAEASRCLDCDELCSLCVTVCPNRANHAYEITPLSFQLPKLTGKNGQLIADGNVPFEVKQAVQIVNFADYCNECGNCTTFCPTAGAPFRDKPRFHIDRPGFELAHYDAFLFETKGTTTVLNAKIGGHDHVLEVTNAKAIYRNSQVEIAFACSDWSVLSIRSLQKAADGQTEDLQICGTMIVLLAARQVLPV